ncbi:hypothetical protein F4824DRAFT_457229 [Ustulina deusta]|nr:hypothetical protein F4824DRAFT_457229 [Ustulina deusta]
MTDNHRVRAAPSSMPRRQLRANMEATVRGFIMSHYGANHILDYPAFIAEKLTPDCKLMVAPGAFLEALGTAPNVRFDNAAVIKGQRDDLSVCRALQTVVSNVTIDDAGRRAAARSMHVVRFVDGVEMTAEYSWFFDLVDDGSLIKRITQFCGEGARETYEKRAYMLGDIDAPDSGPEN